MEQERRAHACRPPHRVAQGRGERRAERSEERTVRGRVARVRGEGGDEEEKEGGRAHAPRTHAKRLGCTPRPAEPAEGTGSSRVQRSGAGASGYVSAMLRLGSVPYLVGRPLDLGLEADEGVRYERRVPARLVQGLRGGELDVALVSAIELFRQPGARPVRGLAVAGRGEVDSVQVFLRRPLDQVRRLALDPSSRAAAALVQVLLAERDGGPPEYLEVPLGTDPREADADAWLRIGDRALEETWLEGLDHWNPSEAWTRSTGLPFVFATWLVTEGAAVGPHLASLHAAAERGVAARRALAEEAAPVLGLPAKDLTRYLVEQCVFTLGDEMGDALRLYGERARALGLASQGLGRFLEAPDGTPCRG